VEAHERTIRRHTAHVIAVIEGLTADDHIRVEIADGVHLTQPIEKKAMKGIWRRGFWFYLAAGPTGIKRTSKEVETLEGSSKMHQFEDIGVSPFVRYRKKSCHQCSSCWNGRSDECEREAIAGPSKKWELKLKSGANAEVALTRSALEREGDEMDATVLADEFIAVEVDSLQEPYVIGRALGQVQVYTGPRKREFMGWLEEGDKVIRIEAYRGLGPILTPTGREFFCYHGDVRVAQLAVEPIETRASRRAAAVVGAAQTFRLADGERAKIVKRLPLEVAC
jgi:hypothetical protein